MYAPAYAGAAVAEAKAKAKASMAKYLASLVKREEEGWTVLAAEVPQAPDERFFSSADELEQAPLIPAKRKAEDEPMEDSPWGGAGAEGPDTPVRGVPGAPEPAGGGRDLPDLTGIPMPKAGGSGAARPGAGLWRDELAPHQGPGGAALGPALDDEQTGRRGPLGPTTGPGTRPGLGEKPHQGESGGVPLGQVLR